MPGRSQAGVSARRCARQSPAPKVSLYEGDVLYLAQSQTSALVLVADAQLPYRNVGFGSEADLQCSRPLGSLFKVSYRPSTDAAINEIPRHVSREIVELRCPAM